MRTPFFSGWPGRFCPVTYRHGVGHRDGGVLGVRRIGGARAASLRRHHLPDISYLFVNALVVSRHLLFVIAPQHERRLRFPAPHSGKNA